MGNNAVFVDDSPTFYDNIEYDGMATLLSQNPQTVVVNDSVIPSESFISMMPLMMNWANTFNKENNDKKENNNMEMFSNTTEEDVARAISVSMKINGENSPLKETLIKTKFDLSKLYTTRLIVNNTKNDLWGITYEGKLVRLESVREKLKDKTYHVNNFLDDSGVDAKILLQLRDPNGMTTVDYVEPPKGRDPVLIREFGLLVFKTENDILELEKIYGSRVDIVNSYVFGKHITNSGLTTTVLNLSTNSRFWYTSGNKVYEIPRIEGEERKTLMSEHDLWDSDNINTKDLLIVRVESGINEKTKKRNVVHSEVRWIKRFKQINEPLLIRNGFFVFNNKTAAEDFSKEYGDDSWEYMRMLAFERVNDDHKEKLAKLRAEYDRALTQTDINSREDKKVILKMATAVAGSTVIEALVLAGVNHFLKDDEGNEKIFNMFKRKIKKFTPRNKRKDPKFYKKCWDLYQEKNYEIIKRFTKHVLDKRYRFEQIRTSNAKYYAKKSLFNILNKKSSNTEKVKLLKRLTTSNAYGADKIHNIMKNIVKQNKISEILSKTYDNAINAIFKNSSFRVFIENKISNNPFFEKIHNGLGWVKDKLVSGAKWVWNGTKQLFSNIKSIWHAPSKLKTIKLAFASKIASIKTFLAGLLASFGIKAFIPATVMLL